MIIEIAAGIVAVAAVVFVAFLVPVLIQFRKTAEESAHLLRRMDEDLPVLFREAAQAGLPARLADCGVDRALIGPMAAEAAQQWTGKFNPRPLDERSLRELYEGAF